MVVRVLNLYNDSPKFIQSVILEMLTLNEKVLEFSAAYTFVE
jgi:hypothetical protein